MISDQLTIKDLGLSRLGLGAVQFGIDYGFTGAITQDEVNGILSESLKDGINFIDTARGYGDSEEKIGHFLKKNPDHNFIVATKLDKTDESKVKDYDSFKSFINESIDLSLKALQASSLDVLQLHQTESFIIESDYFWDCIAETKKDGRIKFFGISVYDVEDAMDMIKRHEDLIDMVQLPYSISGSRL